MEELAHNLNKNIPNSQIVELPYYSTTFKGIVKNAIFAWKNQGDVNHIFSITDGYLALFVKKPIITIHDLKSFSALSYFGRIIAKLLFILLPSIKCRTYTAISSQTKKEFINIAPWRKKNIHLIYNPVNPIFFNTTDKIGITTPPTILHVGTALHKNLSNVIRAIDGLGYKLVIVGKLFEEQKLLLSTSNIDYENCYDITIDKLSKLYHDSDVISFPSSYEGFGMPVIEANASGVPIIAGDIPILHEIGNNAAYFVNPNDIKELRNGFIAIFKDSALRSHLITKGRDNVKRFSMSAISSEYVKLHELLAKE